MFSDIAGFLPKVVSAVFLCFFLKLFIILFFFLNIPFIKICKKKSILVLSTGCVYDVNATKLSLYYYSVICHLCPRCNVTAAAGWHVVSLVSCRRTPSNDGKLPCALSSLYVKRAAGWTKLVYRHSYDPSASDYWIITHHRTRGGV